MQKKGSGVIGIAMRVSGKLFAQSPEMGALPQLFAATEPDLAGGSYVGPDGRGGRSGHPTLVQLSAAARDPELGRRLWERSQQLTGIRWHTATV
ncbi:hypothetical protein [Streptomyces sp. NPDC093269]